MTATRKKYWYLAFLALPLITLVAGLQLTRNRGSDAPPHAFSSEPPQSQETYLQQALVALRAGDELEAQHQVDHFSLVSSGTELARGEAVLALLKAGDFAAAEQELENLLLEQGGFFSRITDRDVSAGRELFQERGCGACHGPDAEGSDIAPALPGHTVEQVRRQVRAPVGEMPVFPPDQISNSELDSLAAYITSLPGTHLHMTADMPNARDRVMLYYWTALAAISQGDLALAAHNIEQIKPFVTGQHLARTEQIIERLQSDNADEAGALIGDAVAGLDRPEMSIDALYLDQARLATRAGETGEALRNLEYVLEHAGGDTRAQVASVMDLLEDGHLIEAERSLIELIG